MQLSTPKSLLRAYILFPPRWYPCSQGTGSASVQKHKRTVAKLLVDIVRVEAETNKVTEVLAQEMSILAKLSQRPENAILRQGAHQVMEDALSAMEQSPEVSRIWDDIQ